MLADALMMQGAKASAAMVLTKICQNDRAVGAEWVNLLA